MPKRLGHWAYDHHVAWATSSGSNHEDVERLGLDFFFFGNSYDLFGWIVKTPDRGDGFACFGRVVQSSIVRQYWVLSTRPAVHVVDGSATESNAVGVYSAASLTTAILCA